MIKNMEKEKFNLVIILFMKANFSMEKNKEKEKNIIKKKNN